MPATLTYEVDANFHFKIFRDLLAGSLHGLVCQCG